VEANLALTREYFRQLNGYFRRPISKPAEDGAVQHAADRSAQGCHHGDDGNRHQSGNECVLQCRDPRSVADKSTNPYEFFAAEPSSRVLRSVTGHTARGHIASEICSDGTQVVELDAARGAVERHSTTDMMFPV